MKTQEKIVVFQRDDTNQYFAYNGNGGFYWANSISEAADFSWTDFDNANQSVIKPGKLIQYNKTTEYVPTGITGKDAFKEDE